jgi:hypothetical protein
MGTEEVMRKTLELARSQLSNYKTLAAATQSKTQQKSTSQNSTKTDSASQTKQQVA